MLNLVNKEQELFEDRTMRDRLATQVDVLERVKALATLPDGLNVTVEMAANYYEVGKQAIVSLIYDNRLELEEDKLRLLTGDELNSFKEVGVIPKNTASLTLIPRRALLRIGMLLRDSEIAKTVRNYLLNVEETARAEAPQVIQKALTKTSHRMAWGAVRNAIKQKTQIGIMIGLTPAMASLIAMEDTEKEFGTDLSSFKRQIREEGTDTTYTPTDIGKRLDPPLSAVKVNALLETLGFQVRTVEKEWTLTEKGQPYARLMPVQINHATRGVETTKYMIRWKESIISLLRA
nr:hypothetical protein [Bacilli bacterium]